MWSDKPLIKFMAFFDDQEEAWFDGGREWYQKSERLTNKQMEEIGGIPSDFDPYVFWAEGFDPDDDFED